MSHITFLDFTNPNDLHSSFVSSFNLYRNDFESQSLLNISSFKEESLSDTTSWLNRKIQNSLLFSLFLCNETPAGFISLINHSLGDGVIPGAEIGFAIFKDFRGNRYSYDLLAYAEKYAHRCQLCFLTSCYFKHTPY